MTIYQLINVSEAARCGSISQAAKRLHISQPAISESIKELEHEYSITIFNRSKKGIALTQEGNDFISYVRSVLQSVDTLNNMFLKSEETSVLKISTTKIPMVQKAFQDFSLNVNCTNTRSSFSYIETLSVGVLENVFSGESRLGFILISDVGTHSWKQTLEDRNLEYHHLFTTYPHVVLRTGHNLCEKNKICENDLVSYPIVYTYEPQKSIPNNNIAYYSYNLKQFKTLIYMYNQGTAFDFIANSDAVCVMSCTKGLEFTHPKLTSRPYDTTTVWNAYWVKQKRTRLTEYEQNFLILLNKYLEKYK